MYVIGEMFGGGKHPLETLPVRARCRFTRLIPWSNLLVPGSLVQRPDSLFDLRITDYQEPPPLHISAARCTDPRFQNLTDEFVRHRVWLQPPHRPGGPDDLEEIA